MHGSSLAHLDPADRGETRYGPAFLATHRALGACTRELSLVMQDVADGAMALYTAGLAEKPVVRRTPNRCIVQLGPVALTVAWLRSTLDAVADGELLVIVWRGAVAPRLEHHPERTPAGRALTPATSLWEDVFLVEAASESTWRWQSRSIPDACFPSAELAARCVERLHLAHGPLEPEGRST